MTTPCIKSIATAITFLVVANGAPIVACKLFGQYFAYPVDGGLLLADRRPLFGTAKTWRGFAAAITSSAAIAPLLEVSIPTGALFGLLTMSGDLLASFIKRRLGYAVSSRAWLIDWPIEALVPLCLLYPILGLAIADIVAAAIGFFLLASLLSPWLYRLHIRNRPY